MMKSFINVAGAGALAVSMAGCAGQSPVGAAITRINTNDCVVGNGVNSPIFGVVVTKFSETCGDRKTANAMILSPSRELNAVGLTMAKKQSPEVRQAADEVRAQGMAAPSLVDRKKNCTVASVDQKTGSMSLTCS